MCVCCSLRDVMVMQFVVMCVSHWLCLCVCFLLVGEAEFPPGGGAPPGPAPRGKGHEPGGAGERADQPVFSHHHQHLLLLLHLTTPPSSSATPTSRCWLRLTLASPSPRSPPVPPTTRPNPAPPFRAATPPSAQGGSPSWHGDAMATPHAGDCWGAPASLEDSTTQYPYTGSHECQ